MNLVDSIKKFVVEIANDQRKAVSLLSVVVGVGVVLILWFLAYFLQYVWY